MQHAVADQRQREHRRDEQQPSQRRLMRVSLELTHEHEQRHTQERNHEQHPQITPPHTGVLLADTEMSLGQPALAGHLAEQLDIQQRDRARLQTAAERLRQ